MMILEGLNAKDITLICLSILAVGFAYGVGLFIIIVNIKTQDPNMLMLMGTVIGFFISEAKNFNTYWTGSTRSSTDKDKVIANMQPANQQPTTLIKDSGPVTVNTPSSAENANVGNDSNV